MDLHDAATVGKIPQSAFRSHVPLTDAGVRLATAPQLRARNSFFHNFTFFCDLKKKTKDEDGRDQG